MDDSRIMGMKVHQALQDLPRPPLQHLFINVLVLLAVPEATEQCACGCSKEQMPLCPSKPAPTASPCGAWCRHMPYKIH